MSLARAFTLETINTIFKVEAKCKISSQSQILYINCLMHHFLQKDEDENQLKQFEIFEADIKNFDKWKTNFEELERAGLVHISVMRLVQFNDVWSKHITTFMNEKQSTLMPYDRKEIDDYEHILYNSHQLYELCGMKYKLKSDQVNALLQMFIAEQKTLKKKYDSESDCIKHFVYWAQTNKDKAPAKSSASSQGRILGRD